MRRFLALFLAVMFALSAPLSAQSPEGENRIALLIGAASYENLPRLNNTLNDVALLENTLAGLGFDVVTLRNPSADDLRAGVKAFSFAAETADVALIYFAGHGIEFAGQNYLLPVDSGADSRADVVGSSISLDDLLSAVHRSRQLRLILLDSCRDDPFPASEAPVYLSQTPTQQSQPAENGGILTRGLSGLAEPSPARGTLVAFAAEAGKTAIDGDGDNSPFAKALSVALTEPDLEIGLAFRRIRDLVVDETGHRQVPHTYGSLSGNPYFLAGRGTVLNQLYSFDRKAAWAILDRDQEGQLEQLADEGDLRALKGLAYMRLDPDGSRFAPKEAVVYLRRASEEGDPEAIYELGRLYESGIGAEQDVERALTLYRRAAELDHADAVNDLGFLTFQGATGIPRDPQKAIGFFRRAADLRHPEAMFNFAALIDDGLVADQGPSDAANYLYLSLRSGNSTVLDQLISEPTMFKPETRRGLQQLLAEHEFYSGTIDAQFGPQTKRGLEKAFGIE